MHSRLVSRRDLSFLLFEWLDLDEVLRRPSFAEHNRETVAALLDLSEVLATREFLSHYKISDQHEPELTASGVRVLPQTKNALKAYTTAGLLAAAFDTEMGGVQLPHVVYCASLGCFMAANIASSAYIMLTVANARLIVRHGTQAQIDEFARPQIEGRAFGTMCLSEPNAGSALADIATRATPDGKDALGQRYRVIGSKMWISGGDHDVTENIVHLVLARTEDAGGGVTEGVRGISLLVVPKLLPGVEGPQVRNDVTVAGLNHKMGYRGIPNCLLSFGEGVHRPGGSAGAVGYLVGEIGQGLSIMFDMMDEARIGVGLGAAMLGYRGYLHALQYAQERVQGRRLGTRGSTSPRVPIIEHPDVKRMLLAQKAYAEGALALVLYCAKLVDDKNSAPTAAESARTARLLDLLTPVAKTWPSHWGLVANDLAIQVHGGYGYTRDFDVEQLYRDNRLNPIHEGTTGIQAIDLVGRKIRRDQARALAELRTRVDITIRQAGGRDSLRSHADLLNETWNRIERCVRMIIEIDDELRSLQNATPFLFAFGHAVVAWLWLDQACHCDDQIADPYYAGKLRACRYFFEFEVPKVSGWLAPVESGSDVAASMATQEF